MIDSLQGLATLASDLVWSVLWEKSLRIFADRLFVVDTSPSSFKFSVSGDTTISATFGIGSGDD
jgi:hypothetical protein